MCVCVFVFMNFVSVFHVLSLPPRFYFISFSYHILPYHFRSHCVYIYALWKNVAFLRLRSLCAHPFFYYLFYVSNELSHFIPMHFTSIQYFFEHYDCTLFGPLSFSTPDPSTKLSFLRSLFSVSVHIDTFAYWAKNHFNEVNV